MKHYDSYNDNYQPWEHNIATEHKAQSVRTGYGICYNIWNKIVVKYMYVFC